MGTLQAPTRAKRNDWLTYVAVMLIAILVLSALTYVGPPFQPTWQEIMSALTKWSGAP